MKITTHCAYGKPKKAVVYGKGHESTYHNGSERMMVTNEENVRERKLKQWLFSFRGGMGAYRTQAPAIQ
jgi:hypothetical protein